MDKIKIPILVQDPQTWLSSPQGRIKMRLAEGALFERPFFADGPSTDSVEINDSQSLAKYLPAKKIIGGYRGPSGGDLLKEVNEVIDSDDRQKITALLNSPEFIQVSTFACILRTLDQFEKKNILGRPFGWKFSPEKLICQPRLRREKPGGRYERHCKKISFTQTSQRGKGDLYTSLSREAVAHETAHAIIDGINPHLYDSLNPHAHAVHEALADLSALLVAIESDALMNYVMDQSDGLLDGENAFSRFAENIGNAIYGGKEDALRNFLNDEVLPKEVKDCYQAGAVLSGAIWDVICQLHAPYRDRLARTTRYKVFANPQYSASGKPLADLARRLRIVLYRALDFLPGGDVTLSDYCRAVLLVDRILFGPDTRIAKNLTEAFHKRQIFRTESAATLECPPVNVPSSPAGGWTTVLKDDETARNFIAEERAWLGIPEQIPFNDLIIEKQSCISGLMNPREFIEVKMLRSEPIGILRILWPVPDQDFLGKLQEVFRLKRISRVGTSVIIDISDNCILARLSNAYPSKELYPDDQLRADRMADLEEKNRGMNLFLASCKIVKKQPGQQVADNVMSTSTIKDGVYFLESRGVSLHKDEDPIILID